MKKVGFITLGCRVNQYESNALAEAFRRAGWEIGGQDDDCDLYVVNTCAVTAESERKSRQMIRRAAALAPVAVVGCASQLDPERIKAIPGVVFVGGCRDKDAVLSPERFAGFDMSSCSYGSLKVDGSEDLFSSCRAFVKIEDGCPNACSYCIIPTVRGPARSRDIVDIISECERLTAAGYSELVLTGIEVSAYDRAPLSELVSRVSQVKGIRRLRIGSLTPTAVTPELLKSMRESGSFCPHIHLSLQSGCSRILALMKRKYNREQADERMAMIREYLPEAQISADIICGFPTETEQEFYQTVDMCVSGRFLHVHSFPYSPRPGTPAAAMDGQVDPGERKRRNDILINRASEVRDVILRQKIGKTAEILIEKCVSGICSGHTSDFAECSFAGNGRAGDYETVNIIGHINGILKGETL